MAAQELQVDDIVDLSTSEVDQVGGGIPPLAIAAVLIGIRVIILIDVLTD